MQYVQSYFTDIGVKRLINQDSLAILKADTEFGEVLFGIICDGMGGYQNGEVASKTIVKAFEKWFKCQLPTLLYSDFNSDDLKNQWTYIIKDCNKRLVEYGDKKDIRLGSTVTAILFVEHNYYIAHVGDSRAYEISNNELTQLTNDHSLLADAVRNGNMTAEEAQRDKRKNILLECVGVTRKVNVDFYNGEVRIGNTYLLCTDGLWHRISDNEFIHYLSSSHVKDNKTMRMHLNYLIEQAKLRGEKDNVSAIGIIQFPGGDK